MDPPSIILWAVCIGVGWLIFSSLTGADEGLKALLGNSKSRDLEKRVADLEKRLDKWEKK